MSGSVYYAQRLPGEDTRLRFVG